MRRLDSYRTNLHLEALLSRKRHPLVHVIEHAAEALTEDLFCHQSKSDMSGAVLEWKRSPTVRGLDRCFD